MITWVDVVAIAPELSTVPVLRQNAMLAAATMGGSPWGALTSVVQATVAAHLATLPDQAWPDWVTISNSLGSTHYGVTVKGALPYE